MDKVLDHLSDTDVQIVIANTAAMNTEIGRVQRAAYNAALDAEVDRQMADAKVKPSPAARKVLRSLVAQTFRRTYTLSAETQAEIQRVRDDAGDVLPAGILAENYRLDDCKCRLVQIKELLGKTADGGHILGGIRTIKAEPCEHHEGLTVEEVHDTYRRETAVRGSAYERVKALGNGMIALRKFREDGTLPDVEGTRQERGCRVGFTWEGAGKTRTLIVVSDDLTSDEHTGLAAALRSEFGTVTRDGQQQLVAKSGSTRDAAAAQDRATVETRAAALEAESTPTRTR